MLHRDRLITRRRALAAAGGTVAAALAARKPRAAEALGPLAQAIEPMAHPAPPPPITFLGADGKPHTLAEFAGHGMVVNLWATWCGPCIEELPSLDAASRALAPSDIAVLPLSSDRGGADVVRAFFQAHGIAGLPVLLDPRSEAVHAWNARGIPTSLIIDKQGRAVAKVEGAADWSSPASIALIRRLAGG
jgi:thiol-disulfide isomerase/thioredoxin